MWVFQQSDFTLTVGTGSNLKIGGAWFTIMFAILWYLFAGIVNIIILYTWSNVVTSLVNTDESTEYLP